MSCLCPQPIRPEFKESYKDLLNKPQINGVTLEGNLTPANLGIKAGAQFKIVSQLPVTDIDEATVYLVPVQVSQTDNIYQEWIYINNAWEKIGEPINIENAKTSVRWDNLVGNYEESMLGAVYLTSVAEAERYFGKLDVNTAYLGIATDSFSRGILIYNNTSQQANISYYSSSIGGSQEIETLYPGNKAGFVGTMFVGENNKLIFTGEFYQTPVDMGTT